MLINENTHLRYYTENSCYVAFFILKIACCFDRATSCDFLSLLPPKINKNHRRSPQVKLCSENLSTDLKLKEKSRENFLPFHHNQSFANK